MSHIKSFNQHVWPRDYSPDEPKENKGVPSATCLSQARTMAIFPILQSLYDCERNGLLDLLLKWEYKLEKHCNSGDCSNNKLGVANGIAKKIRELLAKYENGYFGTLYSNVQRAIYVSLGKKRLKWYIFKRGTKSTEENKDNEEGQNKNENDKTENESNNTGNESDNQSDEIMTENENNSQIQSNNNNNGSVQIEEVVTEAEDQSMTNNNIPTTENSEQNAEGQSSPNQTKNETRNLKHITRSHSKKKSNKNNTNSKNESSESVSSENESSDESSDSEDESSDSEGENNKQRNIKKITRSHSKKNSSKSKKVRVRKRLSKKRTKGRKGYGLPKRRRPRQTRAGNGSSPLPCLGPSKLSGDNKIQRHFKKLSLKKLRNNIKKN